MAHGDDLCEGAPWPSLACLSRDLKCIPGRVLGCAQDLRLRSRLLPPSGHVVSLPPAAQKGPCASVWRPAGGSKHGPQSNSCLWQCERNDQTSLCFPLKPSRECSYPLLLGMTLGLLRRQTALSCWKALLAASFDPRLRNLVREGLSVTADAPAAVADFVSTHSKHALKSSVRPLADLDPTRHLPLMRHDEAIRRV